MFGVINIDKPLRYTSHDVISQLRRILNIKQIGHAGTLDPMAVGVLPVCIGKATRIIEYLYSDKAYRAYIKLGVSTDTLDAEGEIIEQKPVSYDEEAVKKILAGFQGEIYQKPPMYSAVHYKGKRLYEYARANINIEDIPERKVNISRIELIEVLEAGTPFPTVIIDIECSSGTYIRSIAADLGEKLGCGASLAYLIRTRAGKLKIEESKTLEELKHLKDKDLIEQAIINPVGIIDLIQHDIIQEELEKISKGQYIKICDKETLSGIEKIQLVYENKLIGVARIEEDRAYPVKVFI